MSLNTNALLKPREIIENYESDFHDIIRQTDQEEIFKKVIGMELQKQMITDAIYASDPVHIILTGPPGNGKTLMLECIRDAFPHYTVWGDTVTSSGIGVIESIISIGPRLRFLLIDEIEKFNKKDRHAFLGLLARGNISRKLRDRNIELSGLKVWFLATCNNFDYMEKYEKPFVNRCERIDIPALSYETYLFVSGKRLLKEDGIDNEDIGRYIAQRAFHEFGRETDMRRAIRIARMSNSRAVTTESTVNKDVVDSIVANFVQNRRKP